MSSKPKKANTKIQANKDSVAVGKLSVKGSIAGSMVVGNRNVVGYTSEQVSTLITQISTIFQPKTFDGICPYKGLDAFQEKDADLFFGREKLVESLMGRIKESRVVFVTGSSGSGKSSLVRAGLIPKLKNARNSMHWLYATMKPGRDPFEAMGSAFKRLKDPNLAKYFSEHLDQANILHECAESALSDDEDQRLVYFIDQFEEIFTQLSRDKTEAFINLLSYVATVENGRIILLFSMRSDFVPSCQTYPNLNAMLSQKYAFASIGAMQPEELVSAIAQPAMRVGLQIDPSLIAQIINDMQGEPGALPLMQFALKDLFDAQQAKGNLIDLNLNDYLSRGGIHKALELHADKTFEKFNEQEQSLARSIFSALIEIGRDTQDTRRTAFLKELEPANVKGKDVLAIVRKLADARLVTMATDETNGETTVTISHEKLISSWTWLKKLVDENRVAIAVQNEIINDAKEWNENQRDESFLYRGARLANAREKLQADQITLNEMALQFIEAGAKAYTDALEQEKKRADHLEQLNRTAVARQLAAQAQSIVATRNSKQLIANLLATLSMKILPSSEAAQILLNHNLSARLLSKVFHGHVVYSVAVRKDGKVAVSGGRNHIVRVFEPESGREITSMHHADIVWSVAITQDGKYVASGSEDKTARIWEAASGKEVARMQHEGAVKHVAFVPDGNFVLTGSEDKTSRLWETSTGKEVARMIHDKPVSSIAVSPDGKYMVSGSHDTTARVWRVPSMLESARLLKGPLSSKEVARMTHDGTINCVAFSPGGSFVVSGSGGGTICIWEALTGKEKKRVKDNTSVQCVAFSSDGKRLVWGSFGGKIQILDLATDKLGTTLMHDNPVGSIQFSPDDRYLISGSDDFTSRVWDANTGEEVARMTHSGPVIFATMHPTGQYVISGSWDITIRVWEPRAYQRVAHISKAHDSDVNGVAFSPDGKFVVSAGGRTVQVREATTGREVHRFVHNSIVKTVTCSPDGKTIASGVIEVLERPGTGAVYIWEVATGNVVAKFLHDAEVQSVAFSPDGEFLVSGSADGIVSIWNLDTRSEIIRLPTSDSINSVSFTPDGARVVAASGEAIIIWDAQTGAAIKGWHRGSSVRSIAIHPDLPYLISASTDETASVFDMSTDKEIAIMKHDYSAFSVAISPDGQYVVSGSGDQSARVWEATTGKEVARMTHDAWIYCVAFSPDGRYIASGDRNGDVRVWLWQPEDLIVRASESLPRNLSRGEWQQYIGDALPFQAVVDHLPIQAEPEATPEEEPALEPSQTDQTTEPESEEVSSFVNQIASLSNSAMKQILTQLVDMQYEITRLQGETVLAQHKDQISLFISAYPFGILFSTIINLSVQSTSKRKDFIRCVNAFNNQAAVSRCYLHREGRLVLEASIPNTYEERSFGKFFEQLIGDHKLISDSNIGLTKYID